MRRIASQRASPPPTHTHTSPHGAHPAEDEAALAELGGELLLNDAGGVVARAGHLGGEGTSAGVGWVGRRMDGRGLMDGKREGRTDEPGYWD